ncbi:endo-beta-N-acetylglucosaminidase [Fervidobacterium sp.]
MNYKKKLLGTVLFFFLFSISIAFADFKIPESSYWYPNDLLDWTPSEDPDAIYNVSHVPLAKRIVGPSISTVAHDKVKIVSLAIMNPSTSGMPSQGSNASMKIYPFTFWQYVDYLVAWAGSAGEGIIVPPSAEVTDAGHKNGVPVLGTIFFPPNVYGGRRNWVDQLLSKDENGDYIIADKLIEVARYYGFDGWFINQETEGCEEEHAKEFVEFLKYFKKKAPELIVFWYDAMDAKGEINWKGELNETNVVFLKDGNEKVADYMFVDFRWISSKRPNSIINSVNNAEKFGISKYDLFAGVLLQGDGYNTPYFNLPKVVDNDGKLQLSLGLYGPCWTYYSSKTFDEFWRKEETLWIGNHEKLIYNNKNSDQAKKWPGFAKFVNEKSSVTKLPFVTFFNVGHGETFFVEGKRIKNSPWYNRSMQDIMPTYRWMVNGKSLSAYVDYTDAYYGGTSLSFEGSLFAGEFSEYVLYLTDLNIPSGYYTSIYSKMSGKNTPKVYIVFETSDKKEIKLPLSNVSYWKETRYALTPVIGNTIRYIKLRFEGTSTVSESFKFNLGGIRMSSIKRLEPAKVVGLKIDEYQFEEGLYATLKLHWEASKDAEYYEIYKNSNGLKELIWVSYNNFTYINNVKRTGKEPDLIIEVVPVSSDRTRGQSAKVVLKWPAYPKPKVDFEADKTLVLPGDTVIFEAKCSETTEQLEWFFAGGIPASSSQNIVKVRYDTEGVYGVKLVGKNSSGETAKEIEEFIVVSKNADKIQNVALNKKAWASSNVAHEKPEMAIDGTVENNSKWCAVDALPHWIIIDLEDVYYVNSIVVKHAEAGRESPDWNTKKFRFEVSTDGENWKEVVNVTDNTKGITKHNFAPVNARYIKMIVDMPTQTGDKAARIYEIEVYGIKGF